MKKTSRLLLIVAMFLSFLGCKDDVEDADVINVSSEILSFENGIGEQTILVESTAAWEVTVPSDCGWIFTEVSAAKDKFVVSVDENGEYAVRSAVLTIRGGNCIREIDVLQKGKELSLELTAESGEVYDLNEVYAVGVRTNLKWTATVEGSWVSIDKSSGEGNDIIKMIFSRNTAAAAREARITVTAADQTMRVFKLRQGEALIDGPRQDSLAVVALYHSLKGEKWVNRNKWLTSAPLASWGGIITDKNGRVTSLVVSESIIGNRIGVEGTICEDIKYLSKLKQFSVMFCEIGGEIPNAIGRCVELGALAISNYGPEYQGNLSGKLPVILCSLPKLIEVSVPVNKLSGELPWELAVSSGSSLNLERNEFSGELPEVWAQSQFLSNITLSFNSLSGTIPEAWGEMPEMSVLDLAGNEAMTGKVPEQICRKMKAGALEVLALKNTNIIPCD